MRPEPGTTIRCDWQSFENASFQYLENIYREIESVIRFVETLLEWLIVKSKSKSPLSHTRTLIHLTPKHLSDCENNYQNTISVSPQSTFSANLFVLLHKPHAHARTGIHGHVYVCVDAHTHTSEEAREIIFSLVFFDNFMAPVLSWLKRKCFIHTCTYTHMCIPVSPYARTLCHFDSPRLDINIIHHRCGPINAILIVLL